MKTNGAVISAMLSISALMGAGCGVDESLPLGVRLDALDKDLQVGSQGEQVGTVHDYLRQYGYFPNADLAREYPAWRPLVPELPADPVVFDERTREGVQRFQATMRLPQTGVVDAETRALLKQPRCGIPDGIRTLDDADKYSHHTGRWPNQTVTWRLTNTNDVTMTQARTAISAAFSRWAQATSLTFTQLTSGTADIMIDFAFKDGPGSTLAFTTVATKDITFDTSETWSVAATTPSTQVDLQTLAQHEIGHALFLRHSALEGATMRPLWSVGEQDRSLALDDTVGISALYDKWERLPGLATDIASGGGFNNLVSGFKPYTWVIGFGDMGGGNFSIHKWNESTFNWDWADGGAVRIGVVPSSGIPWVISAGGYIWRRLSNAAGSVGWQPMPGCARDLGIGVQGDVWIIDCNSYTQKWNEATFSWQWANGIAQRIAVDDAGFPWVVLANGAIMKGSNPDPAQVFWEQMPGCATDIAAGPGHGDIRFPEGRYPMVLGCNTIQGGKPVHVWNQQIPVTSGDPDRYEWIEVPGVAGNPPGVGGTNITVGANARVWFTNVWGEIYRAAK